MIEASVRTTNNAANSLIDVKYSRMPATLRSYERYFNDFRIWCNANGHCHLPASTDVASLYLCELTKKYRPSTIRSVLSSILFFHRSAGFKFEHEILNYIMNGISRVHGSDSRNLDLIDLNRLKHIVKFTPNTPQGKRSIAICVLGFSGALQVQELCGLDLGGNSPGGSGLILWMNDGFKIETHHSAGCYYQPRKLVRTISKDIEPSPFSALKQWFVAANINSGPAFRTIDRWGNIGDRLSPTAMSAIVKRCVFSSEINSGKSETEARHNSMHISAKSLKFGFIKSALEAGISREKIAIHAGFKTTSMIDQFARRAFIERGNPTLGVMS